MPAPPRHSGLLLHDCLRLCVIQLLAAVTGKRTCSNGAWSTPPLICRSICNDVVAPIYSASCFRRFIEQPFSLQADPFVGQMFTVFPLGPIVERMRTFILDSASESASFPEPSKQRVLLEASAVPRRCSCHPP